MAEMHGAREVSIDRQLHQHSIEAHGPRLRSKQSAIHGAKCCSVSAMDLCKIVSFSRRVKSYTRPMFALCVHATRSVHDRYLNSPSEYPCQVNPQEWRISRPCPWRSYVNGVDSE